MNRTRFSAVISAISLLVIVGVAEGQIQTSFFGMGAVSSADMPKVSYGILSHPPLAWTSIEGTGRGVYNFTTMDQFVNRAPRDANGVAQIDIPLGWTPGWAVTVQTQCLKQNSGVVICTVPPDNMQDWADFITALAAHYDGVHAPHVKYYEIWNEANTVSFWTSSIRNLVNMAKIAYPILKYDGFSQVLTPSIVWDKGTMFLTSYLSGGGAKYADGVSFHAYPSKTGKGIKLPVRLPENPVSTNAPIQAMIPAFRQVVDANGMAGKPLVSTEGGWGVNGVSDPDMQEAWITHFELLLAGLATKYDLQFATWYTWGHASSGNIETAQGQPTPAGFAYQEVEAWLLDKTPTPCTSSGNIWSCGVGVNLIVWDTSQTCSNGVCTTGPYNAPPAYVKYLDVTGAEHAINGTIALGVKPIFMEP